MFSLKAPDKEQHYRAQFDQGHVHKILPILGKGGNIMPLVPLIQLEISWGPSDLLDC